jgi:hypothetical protein
MDLNSPISGSRSRTSSTGPWDTATSESSRDGKKGDGWTGPRELGSWTKMMAETMAEPPPRLSWLNPIALIHARNDFVARIADPIPELRRRWMADVAPENLTLDLGYDEVFVPANG